MATQNKYLAKLRKRRSSELELHMERLEAISEYINEKLVERGISKSEFAKMMGKTPSEISKYLSGQHNFTFKTITKIENVLKCKILYTPKEINVSQFQVVFRYAFKRISSRQYNEYRIKPLKGESTIQLSNNYGICYKLH